MPSTEAEVGKPHQLIHAIVSYNMLSSPCLSSRSRSAPVWSSMSCDKQAWISSSLNFRSPSQHSSSRSNTKSTQSQTADSLSVLPTLDKPFRQSSGKIRPLRKKSGPQLNLTFWRHLGRWKFCYLCLYAWKKYNISLICCTELERISGKNKVLRSSATFRPSLYKIGQSATLLTMTNKTWHQYWIFAANVKSLHFVKDQ